MTDHEWAVRLALKSADEMGRLFNALGTTEAPRGRVLSSYRQARRAIRSAQTLWAIQQVLGELRRSVELAARAVLDAAAIAGSDQARTELEIYGLPNLVGVYDWRTELAAWMAQFDAQAARVQSMWVTTGDMTQIVGDESRTGALAPQPVVNEGMRWIGVALTAAYVAAVAASMQRSNTQDEFMRQAVAAIDERTTDCCLKVHGQVVGLNKDFHLTGTPRFADHVRNPPFHWNCRTATCLVRRGARDDELSMQMRDAAQSEISARAETRTRTEIHPAHARSRR